MYGEAGSLRTASCRGHGLDFLWQKCKIFSKRIWFFISLVLESQLLEAGVAGCGVGLVTVT